MPEAGFVCSGAVPSTDVSSKRWVVSPRLGNHRNTCKMQRLTSTAYVDDPVSTALISPICKQRQGQRQHGVCGNRAAVGQRKDKAS